MTIEVSWKYVQFPTISFGVNYTFKAACLAELILYQNKVYLPFCLFFDLNPILLCCLD